MEKLFVFAEKYRKWISLFISCLMVLFLFFPYRDQRSLIVFQINLIQLAVNDPQCWSGMAYYLSPVVLAFMAVYVLLLIANIVITIRSKGLPFYLLLISAALLVIFANISAKQLPSGVWQDTFLFDSNFFAILVIAILYIGARIVLHYKDPIIAYYAPAKARIQASLAERQANRKPTKDERIAELERKVAELESKDKDDQ